jgi:hypothetical protein
VNGLDLHGVLTAAQLLDDEGRDELLGQLPPEFHRLMGRLHHLAGTIEKQVEGGACPCRVPGGVGFRAAAGFIASSEAQCGQ